MEMPELPEVEGFRRRVEPLLVGVTIACLQVLDEKRWHPAAGLDAASASGATVTAISRVGKMLIVSLDRPITLALHLKIAGQLVHVRNDGTRILGGHPYPLAGATLPDCASRVRIAFTNGDTLFVNDQRRFCWVRLMPESDVEGFVEGHGFGPDPIDPTFSAEVLGARIALRRGRPIKVALLDQTCVAGIGNIYADESLYRARIHPRRLAGTLDANEIGRLHEAIAGILAIAVPVGGALMMGNRRAAVTDPADAGRDFLQAHGCPGDPCAQCREDGRTAGGAVPLIIREVVGGRGTYFCPECQHLPTSS